MENTQADHYWQVVWAGYWGPIDPAQQLFEVQTNSYFGNFVNKSNGPFDIQILEGADYCSFQECIPEDYGCRWTDMQYTNLTDISGDELIGSGDIMFFDCVPRYVDQIFHIRYHYLDQDTATVVYSIHSVRLNQTKYFHTLIVKRPFILSEMYETVEIPHAEKQIFTPRPEPVFCSGLDSSNYYENYDCKGIVFSAGGGFPDNITFNVSIVEGEEYGTMLTYDSYNNKIESNSFSNIDEYTYELIYFYANGIEPKDTGKVKIHISTTDPGIPETDVNIKVVPNQNYPIRLTFIPAVLAPGDKADIHLEKRFSEYPFSDPENVIYEPFPADQLFNVGIEKGEQYGTILNLVSSDTSDEFVEIEQGFKFIAAGSINTDSAKISIRISTIIDNGGIIAASIKSTGLSNSQITKSIKELERKKSSSSIKSNRKEERKNSNYNKDIKNSIIPNSIVPPSSGGELIFGIGHIKVIQQEILLGETKYYAVKKKTETGELKIEEIKTDYGSEPEFPVDADGWVWQKTDVWGSAPIEKLGTKSGVYWEKKWFDKTDNKNKDFSENGMIRLIGRFWEEGKEDSFKVKLKSTDNAEIEIKIVKPNKLGTQYSKAKDVFSKELNIDSLCIYWGGLKGIPPQFIKGQMRRETSSKYHFYPTYLYEPWTTQFRAFKDDQSLFNNLFFVQENATSFNPPTPNHSNVKDYHYPTGPVSVWYMIENYSTIVHISPPGGWEKYGKRKENGELYFYGVYKTPQNKFNEYKKQAYKYFKVELYPQNKLFANNEARENFIKFFRDEWNGEVSGNKNGLKNIKAQTRIAASYGLLQLTYPTAIGGTVNYPVNFENLPEELLETENLKWAFNLLTYYINDALKTQIDKNGNWQDGLEGTYLNRIWKSWNKWKVGYPEEVLDFSNNYKPAK